MNYSALIDKIAADNNITKVEARNNVDTVVTAITSALATGDLVKISGFGTFRSKRIAAKKGRNPATGQEIDVPAKTVVRYKPSNTLTGALNG